MSVIYGRTCFSSKSGQSGTEATQGQDLGDLDKFSGDCGDESVEDGPDEDSGLVKDAEDSIIIVNPLFRRRWSLVKVRPWTILTFCDVCLCYY